MVVLGMHRSGTSAVTGVIDALGLPACVLEDRFPPKQWNPRGNFESVSLTLFDEFLLQLLGGTWWTPPALTEGWAEDPSLVDLRLEAARLFAVAHPFPSWVWKDPRACLLMPFWDLVLGRDMPRILVLRNPLECAASLADRNGLSLEVSLALTERYLRTSLRDSARRSVFVTTYDELLDDSADWCRRAASFLRSRGLPLREPLAVERVHDFLDVELRHHGQSPELEAGSGASPALLELWTWAVKRRGIHENLSIQDLP